MSPTVKHWLWGLGTAAVSAVGTGITAAIVDPTAFNFTAAGWENLGKLAVVNVVIAVGAYLKQKPLPDDEQ